VRRNDGVLHQMTVDTLLSLSAENATSAVKMATIALSHE